MLRAILQTFDNTDNNDNYGEIDDDCARLEAWAKTLSLRTAEHVVLNCLVQQYCANDGEIAVGIKSLARLTGYSTTTVVRALDLLEARGFISKHRRYCEGTAIPAPNMYELHPQFEGTA